MFRTKENIEKLWENKGEIAGRPELRELFGSIISELVEREKKAFVTGYTIAVEDMKVFYSKFDEEIKKAGIRQKPN